MHHLSYLAADFEDELEHYIQTDPIEINVTDITNTEENKINNLICSFETKLHIDENGKEFWYARDLQILFGYDQWENFEECIIRSQESSQIFGNNPDIYFQEIFHKDKKNKQQHTINDFKLSRCAAYLVAMNSDSRKTEIAFAQTYFIINTRKQELYEQSVAQRTFNIQQEFKKYLKKLHCTIYHSGITTSKDFAIFHHNGYMGLYQNTLSTIKKRKNLMSKDKYFDHIGMIELAANLFRTTQTEEKLRQDNVTQKEIAYKIHYEVGQKVRELILELTGVAPEDMPTSPNIHQIKNYLPKKPCKKAINISKELWKYALLIMSSKPAGIIMTPDLIDELPKYIEIPATTTKTSIHRKETQFPQLVRNLKSNKRNKVNFIAQGYANDIKGGFQITPKGLDFVKEYFKDHI